MLRATHRHFASCLQIHLPNVCIHITHTHSHESTICFACLRLFSFRIFYLCVYVCVCCRRSNCPTEWCHCEIETNNEKKTRHISRIRVFLSTSSHSMIAYLNAANASIFDLSLVKWSMRFSFEIFEMHHPISYTNPRNDSEKSPSFFCFCLFMWILWTTRKHPNHEYGVNKTTTDFSHLLAWNSQNFYSIKWIVNVRRATVYGVVKPGIKTHRVTALTTQIRLNFIHFLLLFVWMLLPLLLRQLQL